VNPASAIATSSTWSWKTTTPSVSRSGPASEGWSTAGRTPDPFAKALAAFDVRVDGSALDRARADERDLDRQVVEVLRPRTKQALHLRAALDLEVADGVRALDLPVDGPVIERDAREVDRLAAQARDLVDAVLDRGEHPEAEQVDLQEAGVGAGVLVPLTELPPRHRRRLHRNELDERPARDHHPAGVLRDVPGKAGDLAGEIAERTPAGRGVVAGQAGDLLRPPGADFPRSRARAAPARRPAARAPSRRP